jgi:hypothetical protein
VLISPNGTSAERRNPLLQWHTSESAASYRIQVATNRVFAPVMLDSTVTDTLLQLSPLAANTTYYWRASASNQHGTSAYSTAASFTTGQTTAVEEFESTPAEFALFQNYPNPFSTAGRSPASGGGSPATTIHFSIPRASFVQLRIYDLAGKEVKTLVVQNMPAGKHTVKFNANDLPPGIYLYQLKAAGFVESKKMIIL